MGYGKVGFGKDEMLSYKQKHNSAVHFHIEITENTTSRSNNGQLLIHNLGNGNVTTSTPSRLLNQVLGIDVDNPLAWNPNIVGGIGGTFTPSEGYSEYYFNFDQTVFTATGIRLLQSSNYGEYVDQNVTSEYFSKDFFLLVPPDPAPEASSANINLTPPGVVGFENTKFMETVTSTVAETVNNTGQTPLQMTNITINYPDIPEYQQDLTDNIMPQLNLLYPNATITLNSISIENSGNISIQIEVVGSANQNLEE